MLVRPSSLLLVFRLLLLAVAGCASSRRAADEIADEDTSSRARSSADVTVDSMKRPPAGAFAGSDEAASAAGSSAGAAAGSSAAAAAMKPDCPAGDADFNFGTNDSEFGVAYGRAKAACDGMFRAQCGDMMVTLDAAGCVVGFSQVPTHGDLEAEYDDCMVEQLAGSCSRCEHDMTRRFYESCTIL